MSRRITGPLRHLSGALLTNTSFSIAGGVFADASATYIRERIYLTTDSDAQFDVTLATPESGTAPFTFYLPGSPPLTLNIGDGPDTTLHALVLADAAVVDATALQDHADLIATADALGHVRVGAGLAIDVDGVLSADAGSVGADASGTAAAAVATHAVDTTDVHGIADTAALVLTSDSRLSDSRAPTAHAASHASAGGDPLTLDESQITGLATDLAAKAPLASPTFTGTPAAPTAADGTNTTQLATTAFVQAQVAILLGSAPGALDTLNELAAALGDDPNFATTITNALAGKQPLDTDLTALAALSTSAFGRALLELVDAAALRTAGGLGNSATRNVGTATGTVAAGDDSRLSDTRTPTAHASSHASAGGDPITIAESQVTNLATDLAAKLAKASNLSDLASAPTARTNLGVDAAPQITEYTTNSGSPFTYTIPAGATMIEIIALGSGAGGGSGRRGAAGSARFGGGGGGAGAWSTARYSVAELGGAGTALTVTIGAGGSGGAARTADDTDGATGGSGNSTSVAVSGTQLVLAQASAGGGGGTNAAGSGGSNAGGIGWFAPIAGGASSTSATAGGGSGGTAGPGAGGGGGGIDTGNMARAGGAGGQGARAMGATTVGSGGGAGGSGGGSSGAAVGGNAGSGGGGGGGNAAGVGGDGGNGVRGGGGGGGGASVNGSNSGKGGDGGAGYVRIVAW